MNRGYFALLLVATYCFVSFKLVNCLLLVFKLSLTCWVIEFVRQKWTMKRQSWPPPRPLLHLALFDMPNLNRFDILSISIFCKIALLISISISIFSKITISISIFLELPYRYRYRYRYFSELPYRYRYRYRYFSKVSIYRQSICHIDISNRASKITAKIQYNHPNLYHNPYHLQNHNCQQNQNIRPPPNLYHQAKVKSKSKSKSKSQPDHSKKAGFC